MRAVALDGSPVQGLPLSPPIASPAYDTFASPFLGAHWTNPTTSATPAVGLTFQPGGGVILQHSSTGYYMQGFRTVVPQGSFVARARLWVPLGSPNNDTRAGLFISKAGSTGWVCGPFQEDGGKYVIGVTTASDTADWSSYNGTDVGSAGSIFTTPTWYEIVCNRSSNVLTFAWSSSLNGPWTTITTWAMSSWVPTELGLGIYSNTGQASNGELGVKQWLVTT